MMTRKRHIRIGMIVEDEYCDAYRELTRKVAPDHVRGYPLRKKKTDYNAFRGGLKSALHRTFLTTKDTKGAQRPQSLNLGHKA